MDLQAEQDALLTMHSLNELRITAKQQGLVGKDREAMLLAVGAIQTGIVRHRKGRIQPADLAGVVRDQIGSLTAVFGRQFQGDVASGAALLERHASGQDVRAELATWLTTRGRR